MKRISGCLCLLLILLAIFGKWLSAREAGEVELAARYYLAPDGDDAQAGTKAAPFRSLNKLWSVLTPGDLVYLKGGDYRYSRMQSLTGKSGTAQRPIRIWAYPGEQPRITRGADYRIEVGVNQDLIYFEGDHVHWKGVEVAHFDQKPGDYAWSAFRIESSRHCTFERIQYHHNGAGMSVRGDSTGNLFLNCDFHQNQDPYSATPYDGADGLDLHFLRAGTKNTLRGCRAWWNADDGFDCWENEGFVEIENCWAFYNGYRPGTFEEAGNGSGFKLGTTTARPETHLRTVRHCIAYKNRSFGIVENAAICQSVVVHNVVAESGVYGFWFGSWGTNAATVRNNIGWKNPEERFSVHDVVDHNSWQLVPAIEESDFISLDKSQLLKARGPNGELPAITFLQPKPGSRLIDSGVDVGFPYQGKAPDLGRIESADSRK